MIELCGEKVVLRTLEREHCRRLWESYELAEPVPSEPLRPGLSVEGADKWFEDMQTKQGREQVYLGVFTRDGHLIGDIQLANINWQQRTATMGLSIACRQDRGKGYGSDAARVLLRYAFEHLDLYRVSAATSACNVAGQRSLEKCGFIREGCERRAVYVAGRRWDRLTYGLLREDYEKMENG